MWARAALAPSFGRDTILTTGMVVFGTHGKSVPHSALLAHVSLCSAPPRRTLSHHQSLRREKGAPSAARGI